MTRLVSSPMQPNRALQPYPAIPEPSQTLASMQASLLRVKEVVELMTGQRGRNEYSLVEGLATVQKQVGGAVAKVLQNVEVLVTDTSALAQRTDIIEAEITAAQGSATSLAARITAVDTARIDADVVLAQRATTLEAEVTGARGGTGSLSARITQVDQARADGDTALASSVTSLTSTVNANSANITTVQSSINGLSVKFGVQGTINGVTGGFIFTGVAKNDGSAVYNMEFNSNVTINGNLLINGTVTNPQIGNNAVSQVAATSGGGGTAAVAINVRSGSVLIQAVSESANEYHVWSSLPSVTIYRDGGALKSVTVSYTAYLPSGSGSFQYTRGITVLAMTDTPGAGVHTYSAVCNDGFTSGAAGGAGTMNIAVTELSK